MLRGIQSVAAAQRPPLLALVPLAAARRRATAFPPNDSPRKCPDGQELTEAECKDAATALGYRCGRADDRWSAMPGGSFSPPP